MIDRFQELINELSVEYGTTLHIDERGCVNLQLGVKRHVQLECDAHLENILAAAFIGEIPPGKFRENILKDALKANGSSTRDGVLAYSERNNKLVLFSAIHLSSLSGKKLADILNAFLDKADRWRTGIETGNTSHLALPNGKPTTSIFDLKM